MKRLLLLLSKTKSTINITSASASTSKRFLNFSTMACCKCVKCSCGLAGGFELIKCSRCGSFQPAPPTTAESTCCPNYYRLLLPQLPGATFKIDLKTLKGEYLKLQGAVHPDRLNDQIGQSWSSWINRAHETLKDPLQRAIYLVNLYEKEGERDKLDTRTHTEEIVSDAGNHDISLVLEVREELDKTVDPETLNQIKKSNDSRINRCCQELELILGSIDIIDLDGAKRCINSLRYWMSIDRELKEKEWGDVEIDK